MVARKVKTAAGRAHPADEGNSAGVSQDPRREPDGVTFGREVRRRRVALRLTLDQLAERAGLAANYLGTIENGKRDPSLSTIVALARGLGIATRDLMGDEVHQVSSAGMDVATLFEQAPGPVQEAIWLLLHHHARRSRPG